MSNQSQLSAGSRLVIGLLSLACTFLGWPSIAGASSALPATLQVAVTTINVGAVRVGTIGYATFDVVDDNENPALSNVIGTSTGPTSGPFRMISTIAVGTELSLGDIVPVQVAFQPTTTGPASTSVTLATVGGAPLTITVVGTGSGAGYGLPAVANSTWSINGSAYVDASGLTLTTAGVGEAGDALFPVPASTSSISASFNLDVGGGSGADGAAFDLLAPSTSPTSVGGIGQAMGFGGLQGMAVVFGEYLEPGAPQADFIGITDGMNPDGSLHYLATAPVTAPLTLGSSTNVVVITITAGVVSVSLDGYLQLSQAVSLPSTAMVGFAASTGGLDDNHVLTDISVTVGGAPPTNPVVLTAAKPCLTSMPVGSVTTCTILATNTGAAPVTLTSVTIAGSTAIALGSTPSIGQQLAPGASTPITVLATPSVSGSASATVSLRVLDIVGASTCVVAGVASGAARRLPSLGAPQWTMSGTAASHGTSVTLTGLHPFAAGAAYLSSSVATTNLAVRFNVTVGTSSHCCGDATALNLVTGSTRPTVGANGANAGISTSPGISVVLGEFPDPGAPGPTYVAIVNDARHGAHLAFVASAALSTLVIGHTTAVLVAIAHGKVTVWVNGVPVCSAKVVLPTTAHLGFSAGSGELYASHSVSGVLIADHA